MRVERPPATIKRLTDSRSFGRRDVSRVPLQPSPAASKALRDCAGTGDAAAEAGLTPREREILVSFAQGMSYARIAEEREIKPVTVRNAIYGIQQELSVGTMQELVLWCVRNGLLDD